MPTARRILVATLVCCACSAGAQAADIPRTADGKPDFNGIWQAMNEANWGLEARTASHAPMLRDGPLGPLAAVDVMKLGAIIAVPPSLGYIKGGGTIPYKPEAAAKRAELRRDWVNQDPEIKCYMPGVPRATYLPYPFQVVQGKDAIMVAYQFAGAVREIFMQDPGEAPVDSWMGWSHGRFDGDTLVVTVTGLNEGSWLDRTGTHHSPALKVTERYTLAGPDHILYSATIEDPEVFSAPWTIEMPLYRRKEANMTMLEFKCVEFVEELLYGAWRRKPLERP
jgi:hypothetical protein